VTYSIPKKLRQQFADTMLAVGQNDPDLVVLIGDISHFALQSFARRVQDVSTTLGSVSLPL
jgi:transketolase